MSKRILRLLTAAVTALPAFAAAEVVRADLRGSVAALALVDDEEDEDRRRWRRHEREERREHQRERRRAERADRQGYRDGLRAEGGYYRPGYDDRSYRRYGRGQYLPQQYRTQVIHDWRRYGYPPPPPGSRYVRVGADTYLTQIATGLVLQAFLGGY